MTRTFALLGPGRLGQAVSRLLVGAGYELCAVVGRDRERAEAAAVFAGRPGCGTTDRSRIRRAELILLALPDDRLAAMAETLRRERNLAPDTVLVHFSGRHSAAVLAGDAPGADTLALHPLQTFADPETGAANLPGSPFSVEGPEPLLPLGEQLVRDLGGTPLRIPAAGKPLYHAAACVACNYLVTLTSVAASMLAASGLEAPLPHQLLLPLLEGTLNNLEAGTPESALTGPIARGDSGTVAAHLQALADQPPEFDEVYRLLGKLTVDLARSKGTLDRAEREKILQLLHSEKLSRN